MKISFLYPVSLNLVIICVTQWNSKCIVCQEHDVTYTLGILKLWFHTKHFLFIALYIKLRFDISWTDSVVCLYIHNWTTEYAHSHRGLLIFIPHILYRSYSVYIIHTHFYTAYTTYCNCYPFNTKYPPFMCKPPLVVSVFFLHYGQIWMNVLWGCVVCVWLVLWLKSNKPDRHEKFIVHWHHLAVCSA